MKLPNLPLAVLLHDASGNQVRVGQLAHHNRLAHFEFDREFLISGVSLSPFKLPLRAGVISAPFDPFQGLHGVFADSLPDGWGLLLMDRVLRQRGIDLREINPLHRLAYLGDRPMGALTYQPDLGVGEPQPAEQALSLADLANEASQIYEGTAAEVLPQLAIAGGSPQGARPKVAIALNDDHLITTAANAPEGYTHWLVKFPTGSPHGQHDESASEYAFAQMAQQAGLEVPTTQLMAGNGSTRYFATKRFDRVGHAGRVHMHTLAGLLNANFRVPDCDYEQLLQVTSALTKSQQEIEKAFRLMVFNVLSGNRDDHTKNFSFLLKEGQWSLSPAYDLTNNRGMNGHHTMSVAGATDGITEKALLTLGQKASLKATVIREIITQTQEALAMWPHLANTLDISTEFSSDTQKDFDRIARDLDL